MGPRTLHLAQKVIVLHTCGVQLCSLEEVTDISWKLEGAATRAAVPGRSGVLEPWLVLPVFKRSEALAPVPCRVNQGDIYTYTYRCITQMQGVMALNSRVPICNCKYGLDLHQTAILPAQDLRSLSQLRYEGSRSLLGSHDS